MASKSKSKERSMSGIYRLFPVVVVLILLLLMVGFGWRSVNAYIDENSDIATYSLQETNITSSSVTIIWRTEEPTVGAVMFYEGTAADTVEPGNPLISTVKARFTDPFNVFWDSRDLEEVQENIYEREQEGWYYTHFVTITGLSPDSTYSYRVLNNYVVSDTVGVQSFITAPEREVVAEPTPIYGKVDIGDGLYPEDVVVSLEITKSGETGDISSESQTMSTFLDEMSYVIDVGGLYDSSLSSIYPFDLSDRDSYTLRFIFLTSDGVVLHESNAEAIQPVNTIILAVTDEI